MSAPAPGLMSSTAGEKGRGSLNLLSLAAVTTTALVRNIKEVSHVEQQLDRPSETTFPAALESAYPRTPKTGRHNSLLERRDNGRDTKD
jgi:hypothetical protein